VTRGISGDDPDAFGTRNLPFKTVDPPSHYLHAWPNNELRRGATTSAYAFSSGYSEIRCLFACSPVAVCSYRPCRLATAKLLPGFPSTVAAHFGNRNRVTRRGLRAFCIRQKTSIMQPTNWTMTQSLSCIHFVNRVAVKRERRSHGYFCVGTAFP